MTQPLPPQFWDGVAQFNQGQYYACHDTLEALWMEAEQPDKPFYQGILQIAVSLYHLGNQNWRGSVILLGEGINRLRPFQPTHGSIEVDTLIAESAALLQTLQTLGPEQTTALIQKGALVDGRFTDFPLPRIQTIQDQPDLQVNS